METKLLKVRDWKRRKDVQSNLSNGGYSIVAGSGNQNTAVGIGYPALEYNSIQGGNASGAIGIAALYSTIGGLRLNVRSSEPSSFKAIPND